MSGCDVVWCNVERDASGVCCPTTFSQALEECFNEADEQLLNWLKSMLCFLPLHSSMLCSSRCAYMPCCAIPLYEPSWCASSCWGSPCCAAAAQDRKAMLNSIMPPWSLLLLVMQHFHSIRLSLPSLMANNQAAYMLNVAVIDW